MLASKFDNLCLQFAEGDKIIAIHIGKGIKAAKELYYKVKNITPNIQKIYTDGNSCYDIAFKELGIDNILEISKGKTKTHMIEAINSSLREARSRKMIGLPNHFNLSVCKVPKRPKEAR